MAEKRILFVENDPGYQRPLSEVLKKSGYTVTEVFDKQQALKELEEAGFDLLLVNLNLGKWTDYSGEEVLDFALRSYPQMPRVLITGWEPKSAYLGSERLTYLQGYFNKYRLAEFFQKGTDLDSKRFCSRIDEIVAQSGSAAPLKMQRTVQGKTYEIHDGANKDILIHLMRCNVLERWVNQIPDFEDYLFILFSSSAQSDEKYVAAHQLWKGLWLKEEGLPYFDAIRLLIDREVDGTLYQGYRDHVVHSVTVYFLGLYLYYGNRSIREAIEKRFPENIKFLQAWKIAALFHDIGYIWSADLHHREEVEKYFLERVKVYFEYPLHLYCEARGLRLTRRDERNIQVAGQPFRRSLETLNDLRQSLNMDYEHPLDQLDEIVEDVQLVPKGKSGVLAKYDLYSCNTPPKELDYAVEDHGILSALLLVCQFEYFVSYTQKTCPIPDMPVTETISTQARAALEHLHLKSERYADPVKQAAAAIALHNVNVDRWNHDDAKQLPYCLTLDAYELSLQDVPLAFLLALADVLQCWGRPARTFVPESLQDCAWRSEDVRIICEDDVVKVCFLQDPEHRWGTIDSRVFKLIEELKRYMNKEDLSFLIEIEDLENI